MKDSSDPNAPDKKPHSHDLPRRILDNLLEGCQVISRDYRYVYVNDELVRHARKTRAELIGRRMVDCYPGIEQTEMFATLRRCMDTREPARMENEFEFPDGARGYFELHFEPVPDGIAILSIDITARKHAEVALQRSMRALTTLSQCNQTLVRAVNEADFVQDVCRLLVDPGGYSIAWITLSDEPPAGELRTVAAEGGDRDAVEAIRRSPWYQRLFEQVMATDDAAVAHFDDDDPTHGRYKAEVSAHGFLSCVLLPVRRAGSLTGVLTIGASEPRAYDESERALLEEVALDLGYGVETLRVRIAQSGMVGDLEEAQARTRAIYDHLPHPALLWKREADRFWLVDINDVARVTQNASAAVGQTSRAIGGGVPHLEEDLARCIDEVTVIEREVECVLPGSEAARRMCLTYGFIPPDMALLHAQDVTQQRETEEQLVGVQRLEAVGRLAGGVAHDFNNLLSVILTYAGFARDALHDGDPLRADVEQILLAGERATTLTRQLLAFSRRQILAPQVTDLNCVVAEIEDMLRRLLGEDIDIEVHPDDDLGRVMADPGQVEQVVMNLAVNARDAMPEGGKLTIETSNVELDDAYAEHHISVKPGRYVLLSVADTGIGMDAKTRNRVFEPFFTTKETGKGTGLGLAMVYGIVKQSGGNIWVYSEPGQGTTFKIYFPRIDAPATGLERSRSSTEMVMATGDETILVVEDEDAVRIAAERILQAAGYRVLTAANGGEALLVCEKHGHAIDLLLTDVVMPQMSGRELADRLAALRPGLEVLFTSGYTDNAIVHHGVLEPGTRFIGKPFSRADLTRRVREALDDQ